MCFIITINSFLFVPILYIIGNHYYSGILFLFSILCCVYYLLNKKGFFLPSLYFILSITLVTVFWGSLEVPNGGVEFFLIPLSLVPFIVVEQKKICISFVVISITAFILSHFLKTTYQPHTIVSTFYTQLYYLIVLTAIFTICATLIFQFKITNTKYENIINEQKLIVEEKNKEVEEKNKDITASISYARRIQQAKLPKKEEIYSSLPNSFVLFKPKDIVSGDFYYFHKDNSSIFIASADCTGHGVPGAFMSMIGSEKLDDALANSTDTSEILSYLNRGIKSSLKQSDSSESTRDGMDIALCSIDTDSLIVKYAGANRPLWIIRNGQTAVEEIKATKKAIGGFTEDSQRYDTHEIKLQSGDSFYISTDGYADTFSGADNKKLTTKKFREILLAIQNKSMADQEVHLDNFIENWKAGTEQVDDILVIGVRL